MHHHTCRFVSICIFVLECTLGYWKWRRKWGMNIWWPLLYWPAQHLPSTSLFVPGYFPSGTTPLREWALRTGAQSLPSLTWCQGENMTLDKSRSFHSMKNKVLSFLWGTWPIEYKSEAAGDHRGERSCQRMKPMQRKQTWMGEREQSPDDSVFTPGSSHAWCRSSYPWTSQFSYFLEPISVGFLTLESKKVLTNIEKYSK